jgi:immune inhibitor A
VKYDGNVIFLEDVYFCETTNRGIATAIRQTDTNSTDKQTKVYTLDGRYVGTSTRGLAKGIYIINGKKTVIR